MPRRLPERCAPDSVREFLLSARQRYLDGNALLASGRRTGAIYLWGYAAEMVLKAAYFRFDGLGDTDPITWPNHLRPAIDRGRALGIAWPSQGAGHNVEAWAELLFTVRALNPATAYARPFARRLQKCGLQVGRHWRETLRYHKNTAYRHEAIIVHDAADWLLTNSVSL